MKSVVCTINVCVALFGTVPCTAYAGNDAARPDFFEREVRPLLLKHCGDCHGTDEPEGGLDLSTTQGIAHGGESGSVVVSKKPDESRLIKAILYTSRLKMPPDQRLADNEISVLKTWVKAGAFLPDAKISVRPGHKNTNVQLSQQDREWWSFQPVQEPRPPDVLESARVRTAVDRFVLAKLEQYGLTFSPDTDRRTLIRRITFDLTGLPPIAEEVDAFVRDQRPDAFERVLERLLASPHYGERWGRHWLDIARYADTNGGGFDYVYPNAWRYRDYVVQAFNDDKPYEQFLVEQLAGDLLPDSSDPAVYADRLTATGLLTLAPKGLGMQDKQQMALDVVDDQIDVLGRSLMGLTLSCARCHDHKFDPISTKDYYSLAGIFYSTVSLADTDKNPSYWPERPVEHPTIAAARKAYQARRKSNQSSIAALTATANERLIADARRRFPEYLFAAVQLHGGAERTPAIAHWTFDEVQGDVVPSAVGPAGKVPTAVRPSETSGRIGGAFQFDGNKDIVSIDCDNTTALDFGKTANFSVSFWLRSAEGYLPKTADTIVSARYGAAMWFIALRPAGYNGIYLRHYDGKRTVDIKPKISQLTLLANQQWHHVVFTSDRDRSGGLWIDGENIGDVPIGSISSVADFRHLQEFTIGPSANGFRGGIDDLAIWNRLLSPVEVRGIFEAGSTESAKQNVTEMERRRNQIAKESDGASETYDYATAAGQGLVPDILKNLVSQLSQAEGDDDSPLYVAIVSPPVSVAASHSLLVGLGPEVDNLLDDAKASPLRIEGDVSEFYTDETQQRLADLLAEAQSIEQSRVPDPYLAMVAFDSPKPTDVNVMIAGDHKNPGAPAPRGFPEVLRPGSIRSESGSSLSTTSSGRLKLARWLTDPHHPLTARVMVNRIWQWHFGEGLVSTPDNFGRLGERPTHPELLDWLAFRFVHEGWSVKDLHRQIVLSSTYRQSSRAGRELADKAHDIDSGNRLLWRMNRRRLEAEALRDSMLAVSGRLDRAVGGTVNSWKEKDFSVNDKNEETANYNTLRRSIYLPIVRGAAVHDMLQLFDFGDPNSINLKRDVTTVASQALFFMNNPFVIKQGRGFAKVLLSSDQTDRVSKIRAAYRLAFSRAPTESEIARALEFVGESAEERGWALFCQSLFCMNEFLYVD